MGGGVGLPGVLSVGGGLEGGGSRSDVDVEAAVGWRRHAKGDWARPGRVQRVESRGEGGCGSGQRRREGGGRGWGKSEARFWVEAPEMMEMVGAGIRCLSLLIVTNSGWLGRKKQGEGPGGKRMGQGRRGGQGEKVGVKADALVDENDVDGRQEKKRRGCCGLRPLL